jgi:hypothetical protein
MCEATAACECGIEASCRSPESSTLVSDAESQAFSEPLEYAERVVCRECKEKLGPCSAFFFFIRTEAKEVQVNPFSEIVRAIIVSSASAVELKPPST